MISHAAARRIDASGYKVDERRSAALQKEINLMHIAESQDLAGTAMLEHASFIFAVGDHPREEAERKENDLTAEIGCSELEAKLMRALRILRILSSNPIQKKLKSPAIMLKTVTEMIPRTGRSMKKRGYFTYISEIY